MRTADERAEVVVRVESPPGTPVERVLVTAQGARAWTGVDGRARLDMWTGVPAMVHAEKPSDTDPETMVRGWDVDEVALLTPWTHQVEVIPEAGREILIPTLTRPQWSCGAPPQGRGPVRSCSASAAEKRARKAELDERLSHLSAAQADPSVSDDARRWLQRWADQAAAERRALDAPRP